MSMENYKYIKEKLKQNKYIILDGANGSELEKRGAKMNRAGWCGPASLESPEILFQIHKDYIEAGCDFITTNTFRSTVRSYLKTGLKVEDATLIAKNSTLKAIEIATAPCVSVLFPVIGAV